MSTGNHVSHVLRSGVPLALVVGRGVTTATGAVLVDGLDWLHALAAISNAVSVNWRITSSILPAPRPGSGRCIVVAMGDQIQPRCSLLRRGGRRLRDRDSRKELLECGE
jgi:hypothetical protein